MNYYIPSVKEITLAAEFANHELDVSMRFLNESVLLSSSNQQMVSKSTKEERNREMSYINFLLYGGSKLLKRASNQKMVTQQ